MVSELQSQRRSDVATGRLDGVGLEALNSTLFFAHHGQRARYADRGYLRVTYTVPGLSLGRRKWGGGGASPNVITFVHVVKT